MRISLLVITLLCFEAASSNLLESIPRNDHDNYLYFAYQLHSPRENHKYSSIGKRDLHSRAERVASLTGAHFLGPVGELTDYFQVAVRRDGFDVDELTSLLNANSDVKWVEQQVPKQRLVKRDSVPIGLVERDLETELERRMKQEEARKLFGIEDPEFINQWHLINQTPGQEGNDHNVTAAWAQGNFGKGSVVCFVDDGLDMKSNDLKDNYFAEGSYDYNAHTSDPSPKEWEDRHGTRCAGEVAAVKNNVCGVGVAYEAKVSSVRILGGSLTEADEAASINYKMQDNHIYSCSWGPTDNGATMEAPPQIVADAVLNGIHNGRGGLGSIFVFASGNGGASGDNCNFDGYTNSIYTITVSAIDRMNRHPDYSESCSANMIVMYSSASIRHDDAIATTDWQLGHNGDLCTKSHGGTSAAAPLASGIYALVHSIRPDLTWRDFQHISVRSAVPINKGDPSWLKTQSGRPYSHDFGYGKLDAYQILELAKTWTTVPPHTSFQSPFLSPTGDGTIPQEKGKDVRVSHTVSKDSLKQSKFGRLEHVTVTVNIEHAKRGDVNVDLISPAGIVSKLAVTRHVDNDQGGFRNWTFMSVAHWDEAVEGTWQVVVRDYDNPAKSGRFENAVITFWGSEAVAVKKKPDVGGVPPSPSMEDAIPVKSATVVDDDDSKKGNSTTGGGGFEKAPAKSGGGFWGGFFGFFFTIGILGGGGYYGYTRRQELWEAFQAWQQRRNFKADEVNDFYEFQRLSQEHQYDDVEENGTGDEFGDLQGPSEAELEELRKGGYLVDDLLFDNTQQESV
ncbi:UNVERIFIED_CONTAM: pheromone processing endoprotease [Siphonaria sp. JEL0065]|nr:pheromone processing endoprotease [Siphonaria sp. JEL0065]